LLKPVLGNISVVLVALNGASIRAKPRVELTTARLDKDSQMISGRMAWGSSPLWIWMVVQLATAPAAAADRFALGDGWELQSSS